MSEELEIDIIEESGADVIHNMAKGALGTIPIVGPLVSEFYGSIIPRQRLDRLADFLRLLSSKFEEMQIDISEVKSKLQSDDSSADFFDEVCIQASKSRSQERKEYLMNLLINGLDEEDLEKVKSMLLLDIFGQLKDIEILILYSYTWKAKNDEKFQENHSEVIMKPIVHMESSSEENERAIIHETYKNRLSSLELLEQNADNNFGYKYEITKLGIMFLNYIGLLEEDED